MISEGTLFVTDENGQHELQLEWLQGELLIAAAVSFRRAERVT